MPMKHLALVAALFALVLGSVACSAAQERTQKLIKGDSMIAQINRNPENFVGRTVELSGNIEEVFGPNAFEVESDRLIDDELLVVIPDGVRFDGYLVEDRQVWMSGRVEQMSQAEFASYLGTEAVYSPVSFGNNLRTVIVVDSLRLTGY